MATTNADQSRDDDYHQITAPPACAGDDDLGIDKISKQEEASKEVPTGDSPAVLSLQEEVAASEPVPAAAIEAVSAEIEAQPPAETTPTEEKPALDAAQAALVGTEPEEKPHSVSAPTESDEKLQDAAAVQGQLKEEVEEPLDKTELEGEVKGGLPEPHELTPEIESNAQQVAAREEREIDLPVVDSKPEEVAEPNVVPGPADDVTTDRPPEEHLEGPVVAQIAETVTSKDAAGDNEVVDQIADAQESAVVDDPCEPEVVPTTNAEDAAVEEASTLVPDADKAAAVEVNTAAEGLLAEKMEEGVEDKIADPEEVVSSGTENGTDVVEEKLKVESVQEDDIKRVAGEEDVKSGEVSQEEIEKLEEFVSSGTENGTNVVEEKLKDQSVLEEEAEVVAMDVKAEEVTQAKIANPEESVSSGVENYGTNVVQKESKDESLIEKEAKDVKAEEVTEVKTENPEELVSNGNENGTNVVGKEMKDESLLEDVKTEEVAQNVSVNAGDVGGTILVKDVADEQNLGAAKEDAKETEMEETESVKEVAAKPNDSSTLEPPKANGNVSSGNLPVTEMITKSTPKSSGNIISKVKQSLVKVKKAITGKSPASKSAS